MASGTQASGPQTTERESHRSKTPRQHSRWYWRALIERYAVLIILCLVVAVFSVLEPTTFATKTNFTSILQEQSVLACLCLGLLFPLAVGEFDLSVGYVLGFTAVEGAALGGKAHLGGVPVILIVLATGALIGVVNGVLVSRFKVHSLIATLGTGFGVSALTVGVSGSQTLFAGIPPVIGTITNTAILSLQSSVWLVLALSVIVYLILVHTPFGRQIYAVGGSERVARLAGIRTNAIKISAFTLAGFFSAVSGLMQLGESGSGNPSFGVNLLLPAFAAIFLGATTVRPGYFNVWGTIVAILLLAGGFAGLNLDGVPLWVEPLFDGVVLLVAVLLARSEARSLGRAT